MKKLTGPKNPFAYLLMLLWSVLYFLTASVLERFFPDAAFFSSDFGAVYLVWTGGVVLCYIAGAVLRDWLIMRLSETAYRRLELALVLLIAAGCIVTYVIWTPADFNIFRSKPG